MKVVICTRHSTKVLKASLSLRSESTSPKVKRSSLLMPASEATNYSTDQLQVVDITDSTNLDAQQSALLDETKKAKKIPPKGVSMSEVIRLHQVSSNRFLSYLGSLISFLIVSSCLEVSRSPLGRGAPQVNSQGNSAAPKQ